MKIFKNVLAKCWISDNYHRSNIQLSFQNLDNDFKVRDHCHITRKHTGSTYGHRNINVQLSHKIPVVFYILKHYDSHLIVQELGKFNLKINVIPNGLGKYMNLSINDKFKFL